MSAWTSAENKVAALQSSTSMTVDSTNSSSTMAASPPMHQGSTTPPAMEDSLSESWACEESPLSPVPSSATNDSPAPDSINQYSQEAALPEGKGTKRSRDCDAGAAAPSSVTSPTAPSQMRPSKHPRVNPTENQTGSTLPQEDAVAADGPLGAQEVKVNDATAEQVGVDHQAIAAGSVAPDQASDMDWTSDDAVASDFEEEDDPDRTRLRVKITLHLDVPLPAEFYAVRVMPGGSNEIKVAQSLMVPCTSLDAHTLLLLRSLTLYQVVYDEDYPTSSPTHVGIESIDWDDLVSGIEWTAK